MMDTLKAAFIADENQFEDASPDLIRAMAYLNCRLSDEAHRRRAKALLKADPPDSAWPEAPARFPAESHCLGAAYPDWRSLSVYLIKPLSRASHQALNALYRTQRVGGDKLNTSFYVHLARWIRSEKRGQVHWVSDWCDESGKSVLVPDSAKPLDARELHASLGLPRRYPEPGQKGFLVIRAEPQGPVYKPTCLDAGLFFAWRAAPKSTSYGLTRHLDTGLPALREWVMSKEEAFKVTGMWHSETSAPFDLSAPKLGNAFWQACREEILDYRARHTGSKP